MATFPTFSIDPTVRLWEEKAAFDPTIRNEYEGGYVVTRARFTRILKSWKIKYNDGLTVTEKGTLQQFEQDRRVGAEAFDWTNPLDGVTYQVRFKRPITYKPLYIKDLWTADFELEEA